MSYEALRIHMDADAERAKRRIERVWGARAFRHFARVRGLSVGVRGARSQGVYSLCLVRCFGDALEDDRDARRPFGVLPGEPIDGAAADEGPVVDLEDVDIVGGSGEG